MDQVKIGKFIAEKRKEKKLTQEQLDLYIFTGSSGLDKSSIMIDKIATEYLKM